MTAFSLLSALLTIQAPAAPVVSVAGLNPRTSIDRPQCLTIAVAKGAAAECGDLRLVHALL
jgi:hypothetical protein